MKITKETVLKLIAATITPGGFLLWGIYELSRYRKNNKKISHDSGEIRDRE